MKDIGRFLKWPTMYRAEYSVALSPRVVGTRFSPEAIAFEVLRQWVAEEHSTTVDTVSVFPTERIY